MGKGVRWDIETFTLAAISHIIEENERLANLLSVKIRWHIHDGRPVGELIQMDRSIWKESFPGEYFHIAYGRMIQSMNRQLGRMAEKQGHSANKYYGY